MNAERRKGNRGPAAASENRTALLDAARRLFADRGYHVPLNAIAREAGVGQAVLYRHFPTRLDLAFAVFDANFEELEAIAAEPGPEAFGRLWSRLLDLTVEASAFVEMAVDARRTLHTYDGSERLRALVASTLERAQQAGLANSRLTADDVLLAQRMAYGVVVTDPDHSTVRERVDRALGLLRP